MTKSLLMSFFLTAMTLPIGAFAGETCEDLWFTRNLIMDRAGYCFGSALGQSLFDNGDCLGKSVVLDAASSRLVQELRAREAQFACTTWRGLRCMRVSVSGWATDENDITRTLDTIGKIVNHTASTAHHKNAQ